MNLKVKKFGNLAERIDYSKQNQSVMPELPNLNFINIESFHRFRDVSLEALFHQFFPITSKNGNKILTLNKVIIEPPVRSFEMVRDALGSYEFPIKLDFNFQIIQKQIKISNLAIYKTTLNALKKWLNQKLRFAKPKLKIRRKDERMIFIDAEATKSKLVAEITVVRTTQDYLIFDLHLKNNEQVFFGNYPMISEKGTFLINGNEKIVIFQLVRSPGVYYLSNVVDNEPHLNAELIPDRGSWIYLLMRNLPFKTDEGTEYKPVLEMVLDKSKNNNLLFTDLLTIFGFDQKYTLDLFNQSEILLNTYKKHELLGNRERTINRVYGKLFRGTAQNSLNFKFQAILNFFFDDTKLNFSDVGRYKLNHKLFVGNSLFNRVLAEDLIDSQTKKVRFKKDTLITKKVWYDLKAFLKEGNQIQTLNYVNSKFGNHRKIQVVKVYADNNNRDQVINLIGIDPRYQQPHLTIADLFTAISYLLNLGYGIGKVDDIDSLVNRNVRTLHDLLTFQFKKGLQKIHDEVMRELDDLSLSRYNYKILSLVNSGPLLNVVRDFFNTSQLSQFLDQTNPLTELSNKRRLTLLGENGLKRESASAKVRDIHPSYMGRICPIETPEGPNIGLIANLAFYASLNKWNFIQTPYWKVVNGVVTDEIVQLTALDEEEVIIAPATTKIDANRKIIEPKITVYLKDNLLRVSPNEVEYLGYSCQQMFSVPTTCIPFLHHNDANRALMGTNMQKQAVPLLEADSPIIGTGNEYAIARDSGFGIVSRTDGEVIYSDSSEIRVQPSDKSDPITYHLINFLPSNQRTALFNRNLVKIGDKVHKRQLLADGSSIDNGELAIGKNVLVAFMTWKGYNFEDAIIVSDRLVRDDTFTSLHIEEYEIRRLRTGLGEERFTDQIPNSSPHSRRFLDDQGIVMIGSEVEAGDILVGKVTPRDKGQQSPEDLLLNQLFKGREQNVENNSLVVPNGGGGIVQDIKFYPETEYGENLVADVIEVVKVYIVQKIRIKEGDKLANRHGNKGVISKILPEYSMPYLADGTPIDIMINPLGVPSRMNIGQMMEMHLAYGAKKAGKKVSTPIFNGATFDDVLALTKKYQLPEDGKEVLYNGETGEAFDQEIALGYMYYLKLSHLVETKIHVRNIGPYSLITQQPLKGKAQNGGQRFGEMEVWALESYGAAYNLQELLTIKSDDIKGRNRIFHAIINNETKNFRFNHYPESFNVLIAEMRSLCLNIELLEKHAQSIPELTDEANEAKLKFENNDRAPFNKPLSSKEVTSDDDLEATTSTPDSEEDQKE